jgi:hypothetical protein
VYGIQATLLPPASRPRAAQSAASFARFDPAPGWYAIGATTLQGAYTPDVDTFAYFREMTPTARIGHAMFVYHVPEQPRGEWVAQCASPTPPLDADEIKSGFGRSDLRVVQFDCSTSWWYPATDAPGWYADTHGRKVYESADSTITEWLHLDVKEWYPLARVIYRAHVQRTGLVGMYRVDNAMLRTRDRKTQAMAAPSEWLPAQVTSQGAKVIAPVMTTGPLQFKGFWLDSHDQHAHPDGETGMVTAWRVMHTTDTPISFMAHLLDDQGRMISGGDGLGVPIEVWQTGEVIVQAHTMHVPRNITPGIYWIETGVYRLDTLERYRILQGDQAVGDRLLLASIEVKP